MVCTGELSVCPCQPSTVSPILEIDLAQGHRSGHVSVPALQAHGAQRAHKQHRSPGLA